MFNFAIFESVLLFAYLGKFLYFQPSYSEAILVVLLTGIYLATKAFNENKKIAAFRLELQRQNNEVLELKKQFDNLSNHVSSLKINQMRSTNIMGNK